MGACAAVEVACGEGGGRDDAGATPTSPTGIASMTASSDSDGTATDAPTTTEGTDSASPSTGEPTGTTGTPAGCNTLTVDPPQVTIMIDNGVHAPVQLNAFCDGAPVTATWSTDASYVASVDEKGLVEAGGQYGGQIVVEALHGNKTAEATVDVFLKIDLVPPEITEADKTILDGATMPDTAVLSYPYDGTVFPKGLAPAELMWHGSTPGDKYLVRYSGQFVDAKVYTLAEPPSRHTITKPLWVQISESSSGLPLNLDVHRMPAGQQAAFVLADDTWTIASEKLIGSVYYWANSLGRVLRINPGADAPEDFLLAGGYDGCSTCHSASGDGTRLILGGDIDVSTWDLVNNVPVFTSSSIGVPVRSWAMSAISPDGTVVIENGETNLPGPPGGQPGMWDATTGAKLMGTGIDDLVLNMPAFSSDGRKIAYVDHGTLSLMALDYDAAARTASNPVKLVDPGPDVTLNGIIFPSVTPDGRYVIYHRGAYPSMLDTRNGTSDMFLASIEQPGTEIRLRAGNGDDYAFYAGDRDRHWNYEPTFAPRASGGYNWAVFTSRRTFGNKLEGDKNSVKQLWLVAIDENPQPGVDPSHPAFWLHGQDVNTLNMRGFWVHKNDDPGG